MRDNSTKTLIVTLVVVVITIGALIVRRDYALQKRLKRAAGKIS